MAEQPKTPQGEEAKKPVEAKPTEKKSPTVAEAMGEDGTAKKPAGEAKPTGDTVPLATFLEEKTGRKDAEKRAEALQKIIDGGASDAEIATQIEATATELGLDPVALKKLTGIIATSVRKGVVAEAGEKAKADVQDKLKPIEERDRAARIDATFTKHFDAAMADMPELKDVVNRDVIKKLTLDPDNANKTFRQIIEDTYGNAAPGKRTIEANKSPGGSKDPEAIDFDRAQKDTAYFAEIMKDPAQKKKYNEGLAGRIGKSL